MAVNLLANLSWYLQFGSIRPLISLLAVGVLTVLSCSMCSAGISHHSEAEVAKNHLQLHTAVLPGYLWHSEAICVPHHLLWRLPEAVPTPAFPPISLFGSEPHWAQQDFPVSALNLQNRGKSQRLLPGKRQWTKCLFSSAGDWKPEGAQLSIFFLHQEQWVLCGTWDRLAAAIALPSAIQDHTADATHDCVQ